jgi:hypothetical protein
MQPEQGTGFPLRASAYARAVKKYYCPHAAGEERRSFAACASPLCALTAAYIYRLRYISVLQDGEPQHRLPLPSP